ncbi:hypothetical protein C5167_023818 [Papaver somniferum]|uniref:Leucine-rich repeat-containing N-terminal plant-type domain-containing protein n=1 Tax=Papaver somniferum TaxID=3469 RepID=A0A4Y7JNB1_PAPSO|nr:polygalacturonase inhibitor 1-like [Papaver somniferum]RZC62046.1 hypothetical protein C5167_023818 [Papaver somniferum]
MKIQHSFPLYCSLFLLFLATATLILPSHAAALGKCNPSDYEALMNIKKYLNNPSHLATWVPDTDCCNWNGVACDSETNRINELSLSQGEISGQIPSSVGDLTYLESLTFQKLRNITGSIPPSITKLKHLIILDLTYLSLSGPIPDFLNQLRNLKFLDLSSNQFSGSIPPNLSELKYVKSIDLSNNKLTGLVPETFGRFPGPIIPQLFLSHNQLSGTIPKSLGAMDYGRIDLSRNNFDGDASVLFNPSHNVIDYMDLSWNQFEFDLSKVKFPKSLIALDLSHNKIFGAIPEEIKGLELSRLNVSYNSLCGIPFGGKMQSFDKTVYFHNKCLYR